MKLRVNLLTPDLLPQRTLLDLTLAARVWLGTLLLLGVFIGYGEWHQGEQEKRLASIEEAQKGLQNQLETLTKAKQARKVSAKLKAELKDLKQELEIKKELVEEVQVGDRPEGEDFSNLMVDLAQINEQRVWLESIQITQRGVSLSGFASKTEVIPQWVVQVGNQGYLQGQTFDQISITEASPWHRFELNTSDVEGEKP